MLTSNTMAPGAYRLDIVGWVHQGTKFGELGTKFGELGTEIRVAASSSASRSPIDEAASRAA
jgi:hypothetical protein